MLQNEKNPSKLPMVNYTNVSTSAANELYQTQPSLPDSTAFLIKNGIIINFEFTVPEESSPSDDCVNYKQ